MMGAASAAAVLARTLPAAAIAPPPHVGPADDLGIRLPPGFEARIVGISGLEVADSGYEWHVFPDGAATFPADDGGWYMVSNSEAIAPGTGGAGAIRFAPDGSIVDAYSVLDGTLRNCAGGPTPWGTWLSCEEHEDGLVWECDPTGTADAIVRPALGAFNHEAAAVDPVGEAIYLTEDKSDGLLYRFRPDTYPDLSAGVLEAAIVDGGQVRWAEVPNRAGGSASPTRRQVPGATTFAGGEGIWYHDGLLVFATKGDDRIHRIDTASQRYDILYDGVASDGPLRGVDNVTIEPGTGNVLVAEDGGDLEIVFVTPDGEAIPFLQVTGDDHALSEIAGPCFSPDGTRLYFSSQRGTHPDAPGPLRGITYEVTGPFPGAAVPKNASALTAIAPKRLFDTRGAQLSAGETVEVTIGGTTGIPAAASAAIVNITATEPQRPGYVSAWPSGADRPLASVLNVNADDHSVAGATAVRLGDRGRLSLYSQFPTELVVDALAYFRSAAAPVAGGRIVPVSPFRLFDTRPDQPAPGPKGYVEPGNTIRVSVAGAGGLPDEGIAAIIMNLTATESRRDGFITASPTGIDRATTSNLNLSGTDDTAANLVVVPIGDLGRIDLFCHAGAHLLGDVLGYVTDENAEPSTSGLFVPLSPRRIFDTRSGGAKPGAGDTTSVKLLGEAGLPSEGVAAVLLTVTATESDGPGYITAWGEGARPDTSTLNLRAAGETRANATLVAVTAGAEMSMYLHIGAHLLADVAGYVLA